MRCTAASSRDRYRRRAGRGSCRAGRVYRRSSATAAITINERSPIPVTTGNSLTIAAGVQSFFRGARRDGDRHVAVDGRRRRRDRFDRRCVRATDRAARQARDSGRAQRDAVAQIHESIAGELPCESSYTTDISAAVRQAQLVLTATSSTQDVIQPEDLQTGAVVCELSLPHDVSRRVALERPDVLVTEGGNMVVPGEPRFERVRERGQRLRSEPSAAHGARVHERDDGARARGPARAVTRSAAGSI